MKSETEHCATALQGGSIFWYVDVRENVVEEQACHYCQRGAAAPTFKPRIPPCVQKQDSAHAPYRQEYLQTCSPSPAYSTTFGAIYQQPYQHHGQYRGWHRKDQYLVDPMEQNPRPTIPIEQYGHKYQQDAKLQHSHHVDQALPYGHIPDVKPEALASESRTRTRYPSVPNSAPEQAEAEADRAEEAELQRTLDQSWYEHQLNEMKKTSTNQARRISALEEQISLERQKTQFDRGQSQAEWEHYSMEKTAWDAAQDMTKAPTVSYPENRGKLPTGQRLQFITDRTGRNKEIWIGAVRKVNGRLYEHRKRLNPWEYEVLHRL